MTSPVLKEYTIIPAAPNTRALYHGDDPDFSIVVRSCVIAWRIETTRYDDGVVSSQAIPMTYLGPAYDAIGVQYSDGSVEGTFGEYASLSDLNEAQVREFTIEMESGSAADSR